LKVIDAKQSRVKIQELLSYS